jgi:hypothetical protein
MLCGKPADIRALEDQADLFRGTEPEATASSISSARVSTNTVSSPRAESAARQDFGTLARQS